MPGLYIPSHIPGKNAYQFVGDERGLIAASPSLAAITQSFTWTIQLWPSHVGEYGLIVRGDTNNPDWGLYAKSRINGLLEVGLQDDSGEKLVFVSTLPVMAVDRPTEYSVRWDGVAKEFSLSVNAAPVGVSVDGSLSTVVAASFGNLRVPTTDPNWYLAYNSPATPKFEGIYYGMSILDDTVTDQVLLDNYTPRAYTGTPPVKPYLYFLSDEGSITGDGYFGAWRMKEDGTARELVSISGTAGHYIAGLSVNRANTHLLITQIGPSSSVRVTGLDGVSVNPLLVDGSISGTATWLGNGHALVTNTAVQYEPANIIDITQSHTTPVNNPVALSLAGLGGYNPFGFYRTIQLNTLPEAGSFSYIGIWPKGTDNMVLGRFSSVRGSDIENPAENPALTTTPLVLDASVDANPPIKMTSLAISPDGTKIAYTKMVGGYLQVFSCGVLGEDITQLTFSNHDNHVGSWNPASDRILFSRMIAGKWQLHTMTATGASQTNISNNSFSEMAVGGMCWQ